jgi:glycosyltransferase involved in cell wall biosynthesis
MRIGLIGHHMAPIAPPFMGGVEAMTWYLARWLAAEGHEVTLFAPAGSAVPGVEVRALDLDAPIGGLARADVSMPPGRFMDAHYAYQRLMMELIMTGDRFDVIHSHSLHYLPVAMGELLPVPMALTLHCPPTPWLEASLRMVGPAGPRLVAVSTATARMWSEVVTADTVIPNGVDLASWHLGAGGPDLAWSGRIVPEKAPHLAVEAARRAGRRLRLAGPILDVGYFAEHLEPTLNGHARYLGHLAHDELSSLLSTSAALLQTPVWDEPFGLTAAEAMASGTPVVSFARGGLPEFIGEPGGRLVAPGDVAGLAAAVDDAVALSRPGVRAFAEATLGMDRVGRSHEELYARLIGSTALRVVRDDDAPLAVA